ncbi:haloalkane dehalogenase [soil metagenome]
MPFLTTPPARFAALPDYPYEPRFVHDLPSAQGMAMHYIDTGGGQEVFLCLHGNPAWSYLYRKMIPVFAPHGRVVAPDMLGFGKSDKPTDEAAHTFVWHRELLLEFIRRLDLDQITLVVQDWGGILGLTLPMDLAGRVKRLLVMNTTLAAGDGVTPGFMAWRDYSNAHPDLDVAALFERAEPYIDAAEAAAYAAPFPDASFKAALRAFPNRVPIGADEPGAAIARRARDWYSQHWHGPTFLAVGARDPVLGTSAMQALARMIPHAGPVMVLDDAGHFVQERGDRIALAALAHFGIGGR